MKRAGASTKDWLLGLAVALVLAPAGCTDLVQSLERKAYDLAVRMVDHAPSERIAVIAIDDASINSIGRWPWSRDVYAKFIDVLAQGKAKAVGSMILMSEPQIDPGLSYINRLIGEYQKAIPDAGAIEQGSPLAQFGAILKEAESALNTDRVLAASYQKSGNVILPMEFDIGDPRGKPERPLPDYVVRNALDSIDGQADARPVATMQVRYPIEVLGEPAAGLAHLNLTADVDGAVRFETLAVQYYDHLFPSLALVLAAKGLNIGGRDIKVHLGEGVNLGNLRLATGRHLQLYPYFYKDRDGQPPFKVDSFFDVYSGKIPADKYRDKIVLVGPTAAGVGEMSVTPVKAAMPGVLVLANAVSSILQEHYFVVPAWAVVVEWGVYLLTALYLILLLPRLSAGMAAAFTAAIFIALLGAHFELMTNKGLWLQLMLSVVLLFVGHLVLTTKRFLVAEARKEKSEAESAVSHRMLALAFQGQGQLDMAFDYFRKCPADQTLLESLYNLALDFERKRQFNKAESVFRYMAEHDAKFRDVGERLARAKKLADTVMLGSAQSRLVTADEVEKPMLGRYQIEKELGKGAMGVVYEGRDPKIGRVVAIKTLALAEEFEGEELEDVKQRFFREAETAGRLNHPNIVTIFDAGEEHDLAYIAMEFLKGRDLVPYTKPGSLLPIDKTVSIIARVADALGYAHRQNVVHRDIKPANIMYEPEGDTVKVTDFGIARITDASKTKTGMVLGSPFYMSPEQLAGKKIDGRSDLFSLAVTLYLLLCGQLPFDGDSMAQLLFNIASEPAPDILRFNPTLPQAFSVFFGRAMAKSADARFQTGEEFGEALRAITNGPTAATPRAKVDIRTQGT